MIANDVVLQIIEPTVLQGFILVLSGVIGWLVKKMWDMDEGLKSLEQTVRGTPHKNEDGYIGHTYTEFKIVHERLDEVNRKLDGVQHIEEERHQEISEKIEVISKILKKHELNGDYKELEDN